MRSDRLQSIGRISGNTNEALKVIKLLGKPALGKLRVIDERMRAHPTEYALRSFMRDWHLFISYRFSPASQPIEQFVSGADPSFVLCSISLLNRQK